MYVAVTDSAIEDINNDIVCARVAPRNFKWSERRRLGLGGICCCCQKVTRF
jgi:hypothetical protein